MRYFSTSPDKRRRDYGEDYCGIVGSRFAIESERVGNAVLAVCAGPAGSLTARPRLSTRLACVHAVPRPTYGARTTQVSLSFSLCFPFLSVYPVFEFSRAYEYFANAGKNCDYGETKNRPLMAWILMKLYRFISSEYMRNETFSAGIMSNIMSNFIVIDFECHVVSEYLSLFGI